MARIAIGGFQHETNTFAPSPADYAAFEAGGGWPGVQYGEPLFGAVAGANIPAAGAIDALRAAGHQLVGTAWAAASPSAQVTADAYERIAGELVKRLRDALPVDGVYLDLHGAMVSERFDDGEGELLRRVREAVGPRRWWRASICTAISRAPCSRAPTPSSPTAPTRTSTWPKRVRAPRACWTACCAAVRASRAPGAASST